MSRKITKPFSFPLGIKGLLLSISGQAYIFPNESRSVMDSRYDFDLELIKGASPLELLQAEVTIEDVNHATLKYISEKFADVPSDLFRQMSRVAYAPYVPAAELDKIVGL